MSTHATISVETNTGEIIQTFCYFDGYIEHVGITLKLYYQTLELAMQLVFMGEIESIGPSLSTSEFYHRDYNEDLLFHRYENSSHLILTGKPEEFNYLFTNNEWLISKNNFLSFTQMPNG